MVQITTNTLEPIEEDYMSRRPTPVKARRVVSAHTTPGAPTCRANGSDHLHHSKRNPLVQGSICFLSP
ncbi:interferon-induced GTP-binding Mx-like protein [Labeo rohita]|uniref:Interferon-induced GTP-binding Mx-like protein n=1 Tax=Labeo rohita TaxID=84645 RepID=A0A498P1P1_LABRO|nr:interferon-induced GTP-binding Mx-like protein [Labeo rohita]